ncbi:hypothetical protein CFP56_020314 [Quercus suber]|uniref:Uncharacterized protein n=1 Tax=Quercus suber TaxID=58331 RepID=A0AAW0KHY5_QUESU
MMSLVLMSGEQKNKLKVAFNFETPEFLYNRKRTYISRAWDVNGNFQSTSLADSAAKRTHGYGYYITPLSSFPDHFTISAASIFGLYIAIKNSLDVEPTSPPSPPPSR